MLFSNTISKLLILTKLILSLDGILVNFIYELLQTFYICAYIYMYVHISILHISYICTYGIYFYAIYLLYALFIVGHQFL